MIHGLTGTPGEMRYLGENLSRRNGFTVSGIALAGHGPDAARFDEATWPDWYRSAEEGLERLVQACSPVFVVGFSMGGLLAMLLAIDHEPNVRAVALLATPLFADPRKARLASILYALPGLTGWLCKRATRQNRAAAPDRRDLPRPQASLAQLKWILRRTGACLRQPALILHSRKDPSVPWQNAVALGRLLSSRQKRRVLFSGSKHVLPLDLDRDRVVEEIGTFFLALS